MHSHSVFSRNVIGIFTACSDVTWQCLLAQHELSDYGFEFKMFENNFLFPVHDTINFVTPDCT